MRPKGERRERPLRHLVASPDLAPIPLPQNPKGPYRYNEARDGDLDYYLIAGPSLPAVMAR